MTLALYITSAVVSIACLTVLAWGVYIDHLRQRRRRRCLDRRRQHAETHRTRQSALRPIGRPMHDPSEGAR